MHISKEAIEELQGIYKVEYGVELTFDEAAEAARRLVTIFCRIPFGDAINAHVSKRQEREQGK